VKEFWKSVYICGSSDEKSSVLFFWDSVYHTQLLLIHVYHLLYYIIFWMSMLTVLICLCMLECVKVPISLYTVEHYITSSNSSSLEVVTLICHLYQFIRQILVLQHFRYAYLVAIKVGFNNKTCFCFLPANHSRVINVMHRITVTKTGNWSQSWENDWEIHKNNI